MDQNWKYIVSYFLDTTAFILLSILSLLEIILAELRTRQRRARAEHHT